MFSPGPAAYTRAMASKADTREAERAGLILQRLAPLWPESRPLLDYRSNFELLCAVVLSAQCTDEQVNRTTPRLFQAWPNAASMARAPVEDVEAVIHSVGFYRTKARHLVEAASLMVRDWGGQVPDSMEGLLALPGVGRKTANLVLSACFGEPGIIVDTHVQRVILRLGLEKKDDPGAIEKRIAGLLPRESWTRFSHAINRHGKFTCRARKPACLIEGETCPILDLCPRLGLEKSKTPRPGK